MTSEVVEGISAAQGEVYVLLAREGWVERFKRGFGDLRSKGSKGVDRNAFAGGAERVRERIRDGRQRTRCSFYRADIYMQRAQKYQERGPFTTMLESRPR